jgi:hypothetical protein
MGASFRRDGQSSVTSAFATGVLSLETEGRADSLESLVIRLQEETP